MRAARERVLAAAAVARANPALRLGNRTAAALRTLRTAKALSAVTHACKNLERTTRLSRVCCHAFVSAGAPALIFEFVKTLNRSAPHLELLCAALRTLRHVAAQPAGVSSRGYDVGGARLRVDAPRPKAAVDELADIVQAYRDKPEPFALACGLLGDVCSAQRAAHEPSVPADTVKRLRGVQKVLQHKFELESKSHARAKRPPSLAHLCALLSSLEA